MGFIERFHQPDVLVRKDTFAVAKIEELAGLVRKEVASLQTEIVQTEERMDEINRITKNRQLSEKEERELLDELVELDDRHQKLVDRRTQLLTLPYDQTVGERREGWRIIVYADDSEKLDSFNQFYRKHVLRNWRDERLWAADSRTKIGTVLVGWSPGSPLPPVALLSRNEAHEVIKACLMRAPMRPHGKYVVTPLAQPLKGWMISVREFNFYERDFADLQEHPRGFTQEDMNPGGFMFRDMNLIVTKKDWEMLQMYISREEYGTILKLIDGVKKPGTKRIFTEVWLVLEYYPISV